MPIPAIPNVVAADTLAADALRSAIAIAHTIVKIRFIAIMVIVSLLRDKSLGAVTFFRVFVTQRY